MADPQGFLKAGRALPTRRPVEVRIQDWREVYEPFPESDLRTQATRCMDCGIPFCHNGCPLGNLIPEWNDLARRGEWREASDRLHATNNFPEFTGRLCPAPCEAACVLGISDDPVTIEMVEKTIAERAFAGGWVDPQLAAEHTGKRVAVIGSGPAGLAAAQQLTRAGHEVTVYERADRPGGLLRYGIPEFKMEKAVLDRRLAQLAGEGTAFVTGVEVGGSGPRALSGAALRAEVDAVVLAGGSTLARELNVPGRDLPGVHVAMDYLPQANRVALGEPVDGQISAEGKHVVIIGGGDTGADCLGTATRQGALSVTQLEIMPRPPESRDASTPWPLWPLMFRTSSAHEENGERVFAVNTEAMLGNGRVERLRLHRVELVDGKLTKVAGSEFDIPADLVLLAMGFTGPQRHGLLAELGVEIDARGNVARDAAFRTSEPGVYVCGDMGRGQSLIVWAIAEGRSCAATVDADLTGASALPSPLTATPTVSAPQAAGPRAVA